MQTRTIARIGAMLFVAIAVAAASIAKPDRPTIDREKVALARPTAAVDPLRDELIRCQAIGQAGAADRDCLRAWSDNRRRFLAPYARPMERLPDAEAASAAAPASDGR
jgi:conjugative transfer region protein TrbK